MCKLRATSVAFHVTLISISYPLPICSNVSNVIKLIRPYPLCDYCHNKPPMYIPKILCLRVDWPFKSSTNPVHVCIHNLNWLKQMTNLLNQSPTLCMHVCIYTICRLGSSRWCPCIINFTGIRWLLIDFLWSPIESWNSGPEKGTTNKGSVLVCQWCQIRDFAWCSGQNIKPCSAHKTSTFNWLPRVPPHVHCHTRPCKHTHFPWITAYCTNMSIVVHKCHALLTTAATLKPGGIPQLLCIPR